MLAISKAELRLPIPFKLPPVSLGEGGGGDSDAASSKYPELLGVFKEASRKFKSTFRETVLRIRDVYPGSRILIFTHP